MALGLKNIERELRRTKLECEFYRTCSAVRRNGVELETLRGSFLQELVEIEEKKNLELTKEIHKLQLALEENRQAQEADRREIEQLKEESRLSKEADRREIEQLKEAIKALQVSITDRTQTGQSSEPPPPQNHHGTAPVVSASAPEMSASLQEICMAEVKEVSHDHNYVTLINRVEGPPVSMATAVEGCDEASLHATTLASLGDDEQFTKIETQPSKSVQSVQPPLEEVATVHEFPSVFLAETSLAPEGAPQDPPQVKRKRGRPRKDATKVTKPVKKPPKTALDKKEDDRLKEKEDKKDSAQTFSTDVPTIPSSAAESALDKVLSPDSERLSAVDRGSKEVGHDAPTLAKEVPCPTASQEAANVPKQALIDSLQTQVPPSKVVSAQLKTRNETTQKSRPSTEDKTKGEPSASHVEPGSTTSSNESAARCRPYYRRSKGVSRTSASSVRHTQTTRSEKLSSSSVVPKEGPQTSNQPPADTKAAEHPVKQMSKTAPLSSGKTTEQMSSKEAVSHESATSVNHAKQPPPTSSQLDELQSRAGKVSRVPGTSVDSTADSIPQLSAVEPPAPAVVKKKRGRPRKYPIKPSTQEPKQAEEQRTATGSETTCDVSKGVPSDSQVSESVDGSTLTGTSNTEAEHQPGAIPAQNHIPVETAPPLATSKSAPLMHPDDAEICRNLADQNLYRPAKINALAVLQVAGSKRLMRRPKGAAAKNGGGAPKKRIITRSIAGRQRQMSDDISKGVSVSPSEPVAATEDIAGTSESEPSKAHEPVSDSNNLQDNDTSQRPDTSHSQVPDTSEVATTSEDRGSTVKTNQFIAALKGVTPTAITAAAVVTGTPQPSDAKQPPVPPTAVKKTPIPSATALTIQESIERATKALQLVMKARRMSREQQKAAKPSSPPIKESVQARNQFVLSHRKSEAANMGWVRRKGLIVRIPRALVTVKSLSGGSNTANGQAPVAAAAAPVSMPTPPPPKPANLNPEPANPPRKRGRPRKQAVPPTEDETSRIVPPRPDPSKEGPPPAPAQKRGRPRKRLMEVGGPGSEEALPPPKKKRGRPRKIVEEPPPSPPPAGRDQSLESGVQRAGEVGRDKEGSKDAGEVAQSGKGGDEVEGVEETTTQAEESKVADGIGTDGNVEEATEEGDAEVRSSGTDNGDRGTDAGVSKEDTAEGTTETSQEQVTRAEVESEGADTAEAEMRSQEQATIAKGEPNTEEIAEVKSPEQAERDTAEGIRSQEQATRTEEDSVKGSRSNQIVPEAKESIKEDVDGTEKGREEEAEGGSGNKEVDAPKEAEVVPAASTVPTHDTVSEPSHPTTPSVTFEDVIPVPSPSESLHDDLTPMMMDISPCGSTADPDEFLTDPFKDKAPNLPQEDTEKPSGVEKDVVLAKSAEILTPPLVDNSEATPPLKEPPTLLQEDPKKLSGVDNIEKDVALSESAEILTPPLVDHSEATPPLADPTAEHREASPHFDMGGLDPSALAEKNVEEDEENGAYAAPLTTKVNEADKIVADDVSKSNAKSDATTQSKLQPSSKSDAKKLSLKRAQSTASKTVESAPKPKTNQTPEQSSLPSASGNAAEPSLVSTKVLASGRAPQPAPNPRARRQSFEEALAAAPLPVLRKGRGRPPRHKGDLTKKTKKPQKTARPATESLVGSPTAVSPSDYERPRDPRIRLRPVETPAAAAKDLPVGTKGNSTNASEGDADPHSKEDEQSTTQPSLSKRSKESKTEGRQPRSLQRHAHHPSEREDSPEIPLQNSLFSQQPSRKGKKRKSLESVLSTLREGKVGNGNGGRDDFVVKTVAETGQQEATEGGGEVGGGRGGQEEVIEEGGGVGRASRDPRLRHQEVDKPLQRRKPLSKRAKERAEASMLSVVDEESGVIGKAKGYAHVRINTSSLVPPKLKKFKSNNSTAAL